MKQLVQSYKTGALEVREVPAPSLRPGYLLVRTAFSAVSIGTEGRKVALARQNLLGKAKSRPDEVKVVIRTARREGIANTYRKVMNRLDEPNSLGYSASGQVVDVGSGVLNFHPGDLVACGGEGVACHSEILSVPVNLCSPVPQGVSLEEAAFTTVSAIALQGVRQAQPSIGDCVLVIGLGLVGQVTIQLLQAQGCQVVGVDVDPAKVTLARRVGLECALPSETQAVLACVLGMTNGIGADSIIVTASGQSAEPAALATEAARDRGRIVVVGGVDIRFPREACYYKELDIRLSRSYGPGRYDPAYENDGQDYPAGYVRWTEQRNMSECLRLMAIGRLKVKELVTHRFPFERAKDAYDLILTPPSGSPPVGVLFEYDQSTDQQGYRIPLPSPSVGRRRTAERSRLGQSQPASGPVGIGFIGAGSYARKYLIPPLVSRPDVRLTAVATSKGITSQAAADRFGFERAVADWKEVIDSPDTTAVIIATRHDLHAPAVLAALEARKPFFVEKPLATSWEQLDHIVALRRGASEQEGPALVGFNRRFAPATRMVTEWLTGRVEPVALHYRVNAGYLKTGHWYHHASQGGGRLIGEACHFVDFACYLIGARAYRVAAVGLPNVGRYHEDNFMITIEFDDGSIASVMYVANGDQDLPKERVEVFCQGGVAVIDDFTECRLLRGGHGVTKRGKQDKGQSREVKSFVDAVVGRSPLPFAFDDFVISTGVTLAAAESLALRAPVVNREDQWMPEFRSAAQHFSTGTDSHQAGATD